MKHADIVRIGIIGDFDASRPTHTATENAILHAANALSIEVKISWLSTPTLTGKASPALEPFTGFFVSPGGLYKNMDGALFAIRYAREIGKPLLGTCGGFQHVILEFTRNVLLRPNAQHAECDPLADELVIRPLTCSLSGQRAIVHIKPGSASALYYDAKIVTEEYRCSFGLAPDYAPALEHAGLSISGRDVNGEPRIVELSKHPFYLATLFVPQLSSQQQKPHPLFRAFILAAVKSLNHREGGTVGKRPFSTK